MTDSQGPGLRVAYDFRFGTFIFMPVDAQGTITGQFPIRVADLIRSSKMAPHELQSYLEDAAKPDQGPITDMEEFRQAAIRNTECQGKVALDVGGYMGEFAEMCLNQGASRAIVLDTEQWKHYGWPDRPLPGVEYVKGDLRNIGWGIGNELLTFHGRPDDPRFLPRPDVLILYNVLYHVKNPIEFLERARQIIKPGGTMLLCTLFRYHDGAWVYYYEPRECNPTDESVFFGPSIEALERWLRTTGWAFSQEGLTFDRVIYRCTPVEVQSRQSEA